VDLGQPYVEYRLSGCGLACIEIKQLQALEGDDALEATLFGDYNPVGDDLFDHNPATDNPDQDPYFHPARGTFNLEAALRDSRERGYGNHYVNILEQSIGYSV